MPSQLQLSGAAVSQPASQYKSTASTERRLQRFPLKFLCSTLNYVTIGVDVARGARNFHIMEVKGIYRYMLFPSDAQKGNVY